MIDASLAMDQSLQALAVLRAQGKRLPQWESVAPQVSGQQGFGRLPHRSHYRLKTCAKWADTDGM